MTVGTVDGIVMDGEWPDLNVRLVTSPAIGTFRPAPPAVVTTEGEWVAVNQVVATLDTSLGPIDVRSPFAGFHMGLVATDGDRVVKGQPVVWLSAEDAVR